MNPSAKIALVFFVILASPTASFARASGQEEATGHSQGVQPNAAPRHSPFQKHWLLKLNLVVSADCEPTSASRIWRSSESSTMDSQRSKLNGTVYGMDDWPDCVRGQAALYRNLAEQTDDPVVKHELLALAFVCDEVADNIEDHLGRLEQPLGLR
jgi:hypothetical protein